MDSVIKPWLWPYGECAAWEASSLKQAGEIANRLNKIGEVGGQADTPVFSPSHQTLGAVEYERCVSTGSIPTRDLPHDWYNGQVWLKFPQAKWQINARHIEDAENPLIQSANGRSRLRDALTLFDESGALLLTTDSTLPCALIHHDWPALFVVQRANWQDRARVLIFGHGLLDAMHQPHQGLCAKAIPVLVPTLNLTPGDLQNILVRAVAQIVDARNLSPLPVMGVPGWFDESAAPGFYDNKSVYRAKPTPQGASLHERLAFVWDGSTLALGKCVGQSLPVLQGEESPDSSEHSAG